MHTSLQKEYRIKKCFTNDIRIWQTNQKLKIFSQKSKKWINLQKQKQKMKIETQNAKTKQKMRAETRKMHVFPVFEKTNEKMKIKVWKRQNVKNNETKWECKH